MIGERSKKLIGLLLVLAISASAFFVGVQIGKGQIPEIEKVGDLSDKELGMPAEGTNFSAFWEAWNIINEKFVPEANGTTSPKITSQDKVWGAIAGLALSLKDPYTVFLPPKQSEIFRSDIAGNFEGVGMEIATREGMLVVVAPLKGTPAEKAGLLPADKILAIDGVSTEGMTVEDAVSLIRGPKGTKVRLSIFREDQSDILEKDIVRGIITIPTLDTQIVSSVRAPGATSQSGEIFIIRLYNFSANSMSLFRKAVIDFSKTDGNKLVIDLRGNPGGFLEVAVEMASFFVPDGKLIVREISGQPEHEEERDYRSRGVNAFRPDLKIVILVNQGSASASEIFAGALRDHGLAVLIGAKTFGKGSVQELIDLKDGGSLKVTIARWLTPNGTSISKSGLSPDIEVTLTAEDIENGKDPQLQKAIEYLLSGQDT